MSIQPEMLTQRESVVLLGRHGVAGRQARDLLRAGLAGAPTRVGNVCLYARDAVEELASRPSLSLEALDELCPPGVFVARRAPDLTAERGEQLAALADDWQMSVWTWLWITTTHRAMGEVTSLHLAEPGSWFESVRGRRVRTGPGREWVLRGLPGSSAGDARPFRPPASAPSAPRTP